MIVVIIGLIGFVGWYVYRAGKNTQDASKNVGSTNTSAQNSSAPSAKLHTPEEAVTSVQQTYDKYLAAVKTANAAQTNDKPLGQVGLAAVKENLLEQLYNKAAADRNAVPFSCTAQFVTDKYTASLGSSNKTTAHVDVAISNGDGLQTKGMKVDVDLVTLKLMDVTCPTSGQ